MKRQNYCPAEVEQFSLKSFSYSILGDELHLTLNFKE